MGRWITGELVVATLFLIAWLFPIAVIGGYRLRVVGVRWREIEKTYFDGGLAPAQFQTRYELKDHPAAHFLPAKSELNDDNDDEDERLRTAVLAEFDRIQAWERYFVPLTLLVTVSALGFWLCHAWVHERWFELPPAGPAVFPATMSLSVVMALVGAYVWGVWELMERVRERNLTPSEIWDVCFRWFVAVPVGYAFSLIGFEEAKPAFAFAASAFPLKSLHRYIRESDLKKLGLEPERATAAQQRIHTSIEGVSDVMATRLEELAIYTVLDMAYANPIKIMVKTGVPIRSVLDWMDQALLRVYATKDQRDAFLAFGMRCSIDVREFVNGHYKGGKTDHDCVAKLTAKLVMNEASMKEFLFRIAEDPQVKSLYHLWYTDGAPKELGGDNERENPRA